MMNSQAIFTPRASFIGVVLGKNVQPQIFHREIWDLSIFSMAFSGEDPNKTHPVTRKNLESPPAITLAHGIVQGEGRAPTAPQGGCVHGEAWAKGSIGTVSLWGFDK